MKIIQIASVVDKRPSVRLSVMSEMAWWKYDFLGYYSRQTAECLERFPLPICDDFRDFYLFYF